MTSYFDEVEHSFSDVKERDRVRWRATVAEIERPIVKDIEQVISDREFPDDLRAKCHKIISTKCVYYGGNNSAVDYGFTTRCSELLSALHSAFHDLARRRIQTRFGLMLDSPRGILRNRQAWYGDEENALSNEEYLEHLTEERNKFSGGRDDALLQTMVIELVRRGVYPATSASGHTAAQMVMYYGAYWFRFDNDPDLCPKCNLDMNDHVNGPPFSKRIGIYDRNTDRTTHWRCPFCSHEWQRK